MTKVLLYVLLNALGDVRSWPHAYVEVVQMIIQKRYPSVQTS